MKNGEWWREELVEANTRAVLACATVARLEDTVAELRRNLAGANRLILAYSALIDPKDAERFVDVIDEVDRSMRPDK